MDSHLLDKSHAMLKRKAFWRGVKAALTLIVMLPLALVAAVLSPVVAPFLHLSDDEFEEAYGKARRY